MKLGSGHNESIQSSMQWSPSGLASSNSGQYQMLQRKVQRSFYKATEVLWKGHKKNLLTNNFLTASFKSPLCYSYNIFEQLGCQYAKYTSHDDQSSLTVSSWHPVCLLIYDLWYHT